MKLDDLKSLSQAYREAMPYLALGIQMAAMVVIFIFLGKWADEKLNTEPWLLLTGIIFGIGSSFYHFFKTLADTNKKVLNKKEK